MNTVSVWSPVKVEDIRVGDRIRARLRDGDSVHEFTAKTVYTVPPADGVDDEMFTYFEVMFEFERESRVPTTPGLYRFGSGRVKNGLVLDGAGDWWWYDLSMEARLVPADLEQVYRLVPGMVLVDAWAD